MDQLLSYSACLVPGVCTAVIELLPIVMATPVVKSLNRQINDGFEFNNNAFACV